MIALILWCISILAFSCLACSMSKHQRDIFTIKVTDQQTRIFQIVGWTVLAVSAVVMIVLKGATVGLSEWLGCLTFAAMVVGLTMTYYPKKLKQLSIATAVLLVIFIVIALF